MTDETVPGHALEGASLLDDELVGEAEGLVDDEDGAPAFGAVA